MRRIATVFFVWISLLVGAVFWTVIDIKWLHLSDAGSFYVPAAVAFGVLLLTLVRSRPRNLRRGFHLLAACGIALVLTCLLFWLWFIILWGFFGGTAP